MTNPYASQQRSALENAPAQAAEGWALVEIARRLEDARQKPDDINNILIQTRLNWRIWTIFQSELVDPDCQVPKEIRENLLSLSNFIDKRSADIIGNPSANKLNVLININRQIGAGLMGNQGNDTPTAVPVNPLAPQLDAQETPISSGSTTNDSTDQEA